MDYVNTDTMDKIANEIKICTLCTLSDTRKNAVPGEGEFRKKLMIIGEAPGFNEDQSGRPFVGMAGMILRKTLMKCGIDIEDVFITNIVKCKPPNNRQPKNNEKDTCSKYLARQINLLKPKIICILGNVAGSYILDIKSISQHRGKILRKNGIDYFITYHPAATIYNRNLILDFENDIKHLAEIINKN